MWLSCDLQVGGGLTGVLTGVVKSGKSDTGERDGQTLQSCRVY